MDSNIKKVLTGGTTCVLTNEASLSTSSTAIITGVNEVYCLFTGTVEFIGMSNNLWTITMYANTEEIIRYGNLKEAYWNKGDSISAGIQIGTASKLKGLSFEYCSSWKGQSKFPIRIGNRTFYKQNPKDILDGTYTPPRDMLVSKKYTRPKKDKIELTDEELTEWEPLTLKYEEIPLELSPLWEDM